MKDKDNITSRLVPEDMENGDGQVTQWLNTRWLNTPFAYARVLAGQTKLEQDILLQVSEHIQSCVKPFFEQGRDRLPDRPNTLFYGEAREKLQEPIRIVLADYGIKPNHYAHIRKAVESILNIKWLIPYTTPDGVGYSMVNVFSQGSTEYSSKENKNTNKGFIDFYINADMADYVFDMSLGYVSHPREIARNSEATHTTPLYMLIKHHCGRRNKCRIPLLEIKKHLALVEKDPVTDKIICYKLPQYNQFKKLVLDKAQKDLVRMAEVGETDYTFTYTEVRNNDKVKGDPAAIEFTLHPTALGETRVVNKRQSAIRTKLVNTLLKRCGDLKREEIVIIVESVKEEDLKSFTEYAYRQLPTQVEKSRCEDVAGYIKYMLRNWVDMKEKERQSVNIEANLFTYLDDDDEKRKNEQQDEEAKRVYPGMYAAEYEELLKRCSPEYREWLSQAKHIGGKFNNILIHFPSIKIMEAFEEFERKHDSLRKKFVELYKEIMGIKSNVGRTLMRGYDPKIFE